MRIMTMNLFNGRTDPVALRRLLDDASPDLVACQELAPATAEIVREGWPHGLLAPRTDHHGGGIASSRPLEVSPIELTARDGWTATLDPAAWPGLPTRLAVTSVHFTNPLLRPWSMSVEKRRRQVLDTLRHVETVGLPHLVVGDFNASPLWPAYRQIARSGVDVARATGTARPTWGPWWWFPRVLRIDHGFGWDVDVHTTRTVAVRGADHSALLIDVASRAG